MLVKIGKTQKYSLYASKRLYSLANGNGPFVFHSTQTVCLYNPYFDSNAENVMEKLVTANYFRDYVEDSNSNEILYCIIQNVIELSLIHI